MMRRYDDIMYHQGIDSMICALRTKNAGYCQKIEDMIALFISVNGRSYQKNARVRYDREGKVTLEEAAVQETDLDAFAKYLNKGQYRITQQVGELVVKMLSHAMLEIQADEIPANSKLQ